MLTLPALCVFQRALGYHSCIIIAKPLCVLTTDSFLTRDSEAHRMTKGDAKEATGLAEVTVHADANATVASGGSDGAGGGESAAAAPPAGESGALSTTSGCARMRQRRNDQRKARCNPGGDGGGHPDPMMDTAALKHRMRMLAPSPTNQAPAENKSTCSILYATPTRCNMADCTRVCCLLRAWLFSRFRAQKCSAPLVAESAPLVAVQLYCTRAKRNNTTRVRNKRSCKQQ